MAFVLAVVLNGTAAEAGPPYVTDDPVPTDYRNWEIYTGVTYENEGGGTLSAALPFAEFNYGAMPNVQVSATLPFAANVAPGAQQYGYGPTEFGVKTRFVQETADRPQISFYPSIEIPASGGGHVQTFLPLWLQKSSGPWTAFGGGGLNLDATPGERNSLFVGGALERTLSPGTTIGAEVYRQGETQVGIGGTTAANIGVIGQVGTYHAVLLSFGRALQRTNTLSIYTSYEFALGPRGAVP